MAQAAVPLNQCWLMIPRRMKAVHLEGINKSSDLKALMQVMEKKQVRFRRARPSPQK